MNENQHPRVLLTPRQFVERHTWCSLGGLRGWLFHRQTNGFATAVRQIGRKLLIDESLALEWIDQQGATNAATPQGAGR